MICKSPTYLGCCLSSMRLLILVSTYLTPKPPPGGSCYLLPFPIIGPSLNSDLRSPKGGRAEQYSFRLPEPNCLRPVMERKWVTLAQRSCHS